MASLIRLSAPWPAMITIIALFLVSLTSADHSNLTAGVQVHNHSTSLGPMTYAKSPEGRGTWNIILSCTATFLFCVWTTVHPDTIPALSTWHRFFYRSLLMAIAAINPEGIAVLAYRQWRDARMVRNEWRDYFNGKYPTKDSKPQDRIVRKKLKKWANLKMTTAFFVVMGGFVIDRSEAVSKKPSKENYSGRFKKYKLNPDGAVDDPHYFDAVGDPGHFMATLTPKGFVRYLKAGYFDDYINPPFQTDDIKDKNKEDYFGKILASSQAFWLLVQSLQRYIHGLTITLLEIHVLIQVACTVLIFLCWWQKPMDVNEPIPLKLKLKRQPENEQVDNGAHGSRADTPSDTGSTEEYEYVQPFLGLTEEELLSREAIDIGPGSPLPLDRDYTISRSPAGLSAVTNRAFYDIIVYITRVDKLTSTGSTNPPLLRRLISALINPNMMFVEGLFITILAGLHAVAWNLDFPTPTERLLWRLSCVGMAVFPAATILAAAMNSYHTDLTKVLWRNSMVGCKPLEYLPQALIYLYEIAEVSAQSRPAPAAGAGALPTAQENKPQTVVVTESATNIEAQTPAVDQPLPTSNWRILLHVFLLILCLLLLAGYLVCILFITVEGYISLRSLPDDAFVTVGWTDYWPHV